MRLLFVCTGNLCRSPIAERLASAWLREVGIRPQGTDGVLIGSAGLQARDGEPMDPHAATALIELGGDPYGFRSRPMTPALADDADLVLTMTRRQRRATLEMTPRGLRRTFTLKEAADLLTSADLSGLDRMPAGERARHLGLRLDAERAWRTTAGGDDIEDPIGRRTSVHHQVADAIATALRPLTDVLVRGVPASQPR